MIGSSPTKSVRLQASDLDDYTQIFCTLTSYKIPINRYEIRYMCYQSTDYPKFPVLHCAPVLPVIMVVKKVRGITILGQATAGSGE